MNSDNPLQSRYAGEAQGVFEKVPASPKKKTPLQQRPLKSVEGYLVMITNVHQECQEDDIIDTFGDFGPIKNLHLNLDRRTGYVKGYCMVEYSELRVAQKAISKMNGNELLGQQIKVDWAFLNTS